MTLNAFRLLGVFSLFSAAQSLPALEVGELNIGDAAPDFLLPGIDGRDHSLADFQEADVLMVAFLSNHCPGSNAAAPRIIEFAQRMGGKSLAIVAINPNNPEAVSVDELGYTPYTDSFEDMGKYAAELGFVFPYLYDGATQTTAAAYGCLATPHIFIFDRDRRLRYKGQFDNSLYADPATVTRTDAADAVESLLAGREVVVRETPPHGCSTKWLSKKPRVQSKLAQWEETAVTLELIDSTGLRTLRTTTHDRVRVFNVWATWCVPCVEEFPDIVEAIRRFSSRPVDIITVSVDRRQDRDKARRFLETQGAGLPPRAAKAVKQQGRVTNSYLHDGTDLGVLMAELDPEWPGGVPHTVMVDESGRVIWRHNGVLEEGQLRNAILAHLGTHFAPGERD